MLKIKIISNLEKVFQDSEPRDEISESSILKNETFSFQICVFSTENKKIKIQINSDIKKYIKLRKVNYIFAKKLNCYEKDDDFVIFQDYKERYFPDLLTDASSILELEKNKWITFYITIKGLFNVGLHTLDFKFLDTINENKIIGEKHFNLNVIDREIDLNLLPLNTIWFHYDAIANYYKVRMWSKNYNLIMNNFLINQRGHGINIIYVPLFTPSLDTKEGRYRKTAQLVDVSLVDDKFIFNFDRVFKFLDNAKKLGYKVFEMSHLATQWGAKYAPKIMVRVNNKLVRYFGWKDASLDQKYISFLKQFLSEFTYFLKEKGFKKEEVLFHISDEPNVDSLETYSVLSNIIRPIIKPYRVFDALSEYLFYEKGIIDEPVVALDHVEPYRKHGVNTFVYFCSVQCRNNIPNRFFNMPLVRLRALGTLMYLDNAKGFLQWGFNFYNSQLSIKQIDPFVSPDAGARFPAGDSFVVYPGKNKKPLDSIRNETYFDSLQDYCLLKMVELDFGKDYVNKILEEFKFVNYSTYPHDNSSYISLHDRLIKELKK